MRFRVLFVFAVLFTGAFCMGGPVYQGARSKSIKAKPRLSPERFRCILIGDSQTTGPNSNGVRTQTHRWDAPILGEFLSSGNGFTGTLVNNSNAGILGIEYQNIDLNVGWPNGGPGDFMALNGANWTCSGDIDAPFSPIGRYRVRFGGINTQAPWDQAWGIGQPLVARIAVRTSPDCVEAVMTRGERGGVMMPGGGTVHTLKKAWGVQIIEQPISVGFNPAGDDVGVGLYLPDGFVETPGQVLQVLGVLIERVGPSGERLNGTLIGYQGRGGWAIEDHLALISPAARVAMIEMFDPDYLMVMLGHNQEPGGEKAIESNLRALIQGWENSFIQTGRDRPGTIYVVPWTIVTETASPYLLTLEAVAVSMANERRSDTVMNYLSYFDNIRPDIVDPELYLLSFAHIHPANIDTAVNLSEDLYDMLFGRGALVYRSVRGK